MAASPNRKEQLWQAQRLRILAAAARSFGQKGFQQTTMAEIARQAEVGIGTIYKFFASKEILHRALLEARAAQLLAHVERAAPPAVAAETGFQKLTGSELLLTDEYPDLLADKAPDRRQRAAQETRDAILAATAQVFLAKGFYGTVMADIAEQAGVAKGTLYNFFPSKEELYFALIDEKVREMFLYLQEAVNPISSPTAKIERLIHVQCAFFDANRAYLHIYISTRSGLEWTAQADLDAQVQQTFDRFLNWVAELLAAGIQAGELRPGDPMELARALIGMLNAFLFAPPTAPGELAPAVGAGAGSEPLLVTKAPRIADLFLRGVRKNQAN